MASNRDLWLRIVVLAGIVMVVAFLPVALQAQECEDEGCGEDGSDEDNPDPIDPCGPIDPDNPCYPGGGSETSACYQSSCMDCRTWQYSPVVKVCRRVAYNKRCSCTDNPCTLRGGTCYYTIPA